MSFSTLRSGLLHSKRCVWITEWLELASWSHLVLCTYQNYPKPGDLTRLFDTAYLECELQQEFRCPRIRFVRNTPFAWLRIISLIGPVLVNGMRAIINQHAHSSCQFCFWLKSWRWNHLELATRTPICDWWFSNSVIFSDCSTRWCLSNLAGGGTKTVSGNLKFSFYLGGFFSLQLLCVYTINIGL